jgi:hypothetical protein
MPAPPRAAWALRGGSGLHAVESRIRRNTIRCIILSPMKYSIPLTCALAVCVVRAEVKVTQSADRIAVVIDGQPFGDLVFGPGVFKPYFYPLRSASGKIMTREWPMHEVAWEKGEKHDHPHQRGLWFAHDDVNGFRYWMSDPLNKPNPEMGKIVVSKILDVKSGNDAGSFTALFDWNDPSGKTIMTEQRTMTFHAGPKMRIVDVVIALTPKQKVTFGDTKEGTFGIRLNPELEEQGHSGHIVNAEGAQGEKNVWGKPSNWVDYYGAVDGEPLGIAVFDHPDNPRHPVRWHVRGYGLFAANPFGLAEFTNDKSKNGAMTFDAGKTVTFRYRVVIHPGDYKTANIAHLYETWAGKARGSEKTE